MLLFFAWLDGAPESQAPLDLKVEAILVAHDGSIGPPTQFTVRSAIGRSPKPAQ